MNLLFIDQKTKGLEKLKNAINTNTKYIVYKSTNTFAEISNQIINQTYSNICFVFADECGRDKVFVENKTFMSIETKTFIGDLISSYSVQTIDFLACNLLRYSNWTQYFNYLMANFNVVTRASNDITGNLKSGGDWILESTGVDISNLYFNSNLQYWTYTLDSSSFRFAIAASDGSIITTHEILQQPFPVYVELAPYFTSVSSLVPVNVKCGDNTTFILTSDGNVLGFGENDSGQLGIGSNIHCYFPSNIMLPSGANVSFISDAIGDHRVIVLDNGNVLAFGFNEYGQLGNGTNTNANIPTYVNLPSGVNVIRASCGVYHTAILLDNGNVLTFGINNVGQLGNETNIDSNLPTYVNLPIGVSAIGVSCGGYHTSVLLEDGNVMTFGRNNVGQLGNGTTTDTSIPTYVNLPNGVNITGVACGDFHTIILTNDGNVLAFGKNEQGQLGNGTNVNTIIPTYVNLPSGTNITKIACGYNHTIILREDGKVLTFGYNSDYQLGNGTGDDTNIPTYVSLPSDVNAVEISGGYNHTAILLDDKNVVTFGYNNVGQLGNIYKKYLLPVNAIGVSNGLYHTMVLTEDKKIMGFGYNVYGELGNGTTNYCFVPTYAILPSGVNAIGVACGAFHTAILTEDGRILSFGWNTNGQLGIGTHVNTAVPTFINLPSGVNAIKMSCGGHHTAVLLDNGKVMSVGLNSYGQLGNETNVNTVVPIYVNLPAGINAVGVSCGYYHTAVVFENGNVMTFGDNTHGQLGNGTNVDTNIPTYVNLPSGVNIVKVECGVAHTAVLTENGNLLTFGNNNNGQLGDGTTITSFIPTYVKLNGSIVSGIVDFNSGYENTYVLLDNGSVKMYGRGSGI